MAVGARRSCPPMDQGREGALGSDKMNAEIYCGRDKRSGGVGVQEFDRTLYHSRMRRLMNTKSICGRADLRRREVTDQLIEEVMRTHPAWSNGRWAEADKVKAACLMVAKDEYVFAMSMLLLFQFEGILPMGDGSCGAGNEELLRRYESAKRPHNFQAVEESEANDMSDPFMMMGDMAKEAVSTLTEEDAAVQEIGDTGHLFEAPEGLGSAEMVPLMMDLSEEDATTHEIGDTGHLFEALDEVGSTEMVSLMMDVTEEEAAVHEIGDTGHFFEAPEEVGNAEMVPLMMKWTEKDAAVHEIGDTVHLFEAPEAVGSAEVVPLVMDLTEEDAVVHEINDTGHLDEAPEEVSNAEMVPLMMDLTEEDAAVQGFEDEAWGEELLGEYEQAWFPAVRVDRPTELVNLFDDPFEPPPMQHPQGWPQAPLALSQLLARSPWAVSQTLAAAPPRQMWGLLPGAGAVMGFSGVLKASQPSSDGGDKVLAIPAARMLANLDEENEQIEELPRKSGTVMASPEDLDAGLRSRILRAACAPLRQRTACTALCREAPLSRSAGRRARRRRGCS